MEKQLHEPGVELLWVSQSKCEGRYIEQVGLGVKMCQVQEELGEGFALEIPAKSVCWKMPGVQKLMSRKGGHERGSRYEYL